MPIHSIYLILYRLLTTNLNVNEHEPLQAFILLSFNYAFCQLCYIHAVPATPLEITDHRNTRDTPVHLKVQVGTKCH